MVPPTKKSSLKGGLWSLSWAGDSTESKSGYFSTPLPKIICCNKRESGTSFGIGPTARRDLHTRESRKHRHLWKERIDHFVCHIRWWPSPIGFLQKLFFNGKKIFISNFCPAAIDVAQDRTKTVVSSFKRIEPNRSSPSGCRSERLLPSFLLIIVRTGWKYSDKCQHLATIRCHLK